MTSSLLSAPGRELLGRLAGQDVSGERALRLSAELRREFPAELVAAALTQQALRMAARAKFSLAGQMLFTRAGLEQASSELTAAHAAARFAGTGRIADLCCGIGGNLIALAAGRAGRAAGAAGPAAAADVAGGRDRTRAVAGVDLDGESLEFARHNAAVCAPCGRAGFVRADVTQFGVGVFDGIFIDPARRDAGGRLRAGQYRPPLEWCLALAAAVPAVGIKAAPGLRRDLVPPGWETEFVAVGRELKEALLWSPALPGRGVASRATVIVPGPAGPVTHTLVTADHGPARGVTVRPPGGYLIDPNPAVTRAGLVAELAGRTGTWQIDPMIAFLSGDEPAVTPFGRTLRVVESAPWHEKRFARRLRELGIGAADIRRRGLAGDVAQIHRRLGLRGPGAATVVMTRMNDRPWGLICQPLADPPGPPAAGAANPSSPS
ncbi:MAG TPA: SAM-dependent methyltransferase [Streptosporangiaceae bacterium]